ncbi:MAG: hypothetical protein QXM16_07245 [Nitrososphaerota archaeon]
MAAKMEYIMQDMVVVFRARSRRGLLVASDVYLPDTAKKSIRHQIYEFNAAG